MVSSYILYTLRNIDLMIKIVGNTIGVEFSTCDGIRFVNLHICGDINVNRKNVYEKLILKFLDIDSDIKEIKVAEEDPSIPCTHGNLSAIKTGQFISFQISFSSAILKIQPKKTSSLSSATIIIRKFNTTSVKFVETMESLSANTMSVKNVEEVSRRVTFDMTDFSRRLSDAVCDGYGHMDKESVKRIRISKNPKKLLTKITHHIICFREKNADNIEQEDDESNLFTIVGERALKEFFIALSAFISIVIKVLFPDGNNFNTCGDVISTHEMIARVNWRDEWNFEMPTKYNFESDDWLDEMLGEISTDVNGGMRGEKRKKIDAFQEEEEEEEEKRGEVIKKKKKLTSHGGKKSSAAGSSRELKKGECSKGEQNIMGELDEMNMLLKFMEQRDADDVREGISVLRENLKCLVQMTSNCLSYFRKMEKCAFIKKNGQFDAKCKMCVVHCPKYYKNKAPTGRPIKEKKGK